MLLSYFSTNRKGELYKTCDKCLEKNKQRKLKNKEKIKVSNLAYYDEKNKQRKLKNKEKIKISNLAYYDGVKNGASHKEKTRLNNMINGSRRSDIRKNIFDAVNFIDKEFLRSLIELQETKCAYCKIALKLDCEAFGKDLMSIERKDNSIGHIKSNCVLACWKCNDNRGKYHKNKSYDEYKSMF